MIDAAALGIPLTFNAAAHFIDRHRDEGRGSKIAIECGEERVSYADLLDRVNRFGSALAVRFAARLEERVALLLYDTPAFAYAFFGAIKVGAVPVPINTLWKTADYKYVLNDCRARTLVVSAPLLSSIATLTRADLPYLRHIVVVDADAVETATTAALALDVEVVALPELLNSGSPDLVPAATSRDDPALWLYSSGSTGAPKGCVHLQHDMVVCAELFAKRVIGVRSTDRFFSVAKLFFAYGLGNALYFPLAAGGTSILWPGAPTAANVYATIARHRPTLLFSVPTSYGMLLADDGTGDVSSVRLAVSAGEALPAALYERFKQRFGIDILDGLGSTEALQTFISNRPDAIRPGSSGLVVPGYDARIVDGDRRPVPVGEVGDLWISGDSVCAGYWNQHEKTKNTIEGQWLRTGDKYRRDADGFFWYAGRSDDMMKVGGLWVSPIEIENVLVEHASVRECAVVARDGRDGLAKPAAYIVVHAGVDATPALASELQDFVRARLADYKRPRWVEFLRELPKTATGKIQRFKLREMRAQTGPREPDRAT